MNISRIKSFDLGVELAGTSASARGRGLYLVPELKKYGINIKYVDDCEKTDIRIIQGGGLPRDVNSNTVIYDMSDAILIPPKFNNFAKRIYQKIFINRRWRNFLSSCDAIVVASETQKKSVLSCSHNVYVIPDCSYYHNYFSDKTKDSNVIKFVWDGQGHNFPYVESIIKDNLFFFKRADVEIVIISDKIDKISGRNNEDILKAYDVNSRFVLWDSDTYIIEVANCDIGLAPVNMNCEHAAAKPCNKLVNYGGLGLPCIASAIPAYSNFSLKAYNCISLCHTSKDWTENLNFWIDKKGSLAGLKRRLHQIVIDHYHPEVLAQEWLKVIQNVIDKVK
jgi:glycosyltransferase involved in cell wall biosynthesis